MNHFHSFRWLAALFFILPSILWAQSVPVGNQLKSGVFYPGWAQQRLSPSAIRYEYFTHIYHFSMFPTYQGAVLIGDIQSPDYARTAVAAAHARGRKIILTIGGESFGKQFLSATRSSYRQQFIKNMISKMSLYGYDGLDIDWEENVSPSQFISLIKELRGQLDLLPQKKILTIDVTSGLVTPATVAAVASSVDLINIMSYVENTELANEIALYRRAGVPASKLVAGLGLARAYFESAAQIEDNIALTRQNKLGGIVSWSLEDISWSDSRLILLKNYLTMPL